MLVNVKNVSILVTEIHNSYVRTYMTNLVI